MITRKRVYIVGALGKKGDSEISAVVYNLSYLHKQDIFCIYPFDITSSLADLRSNTDNVYLLMENFKEKIQDIIALFGNSQRSIRVSFIGHRGEVGLEQTKCFGALQENLIPELQGAIYKELADQFLTLEYLMFKYYVCSTKGFFISNNDELNEEIKKASALSRNNIKVEVKFSKEEIVSNYAFKAIKMKIKPEYISKLPKIERTGIMPQEYQITNYDFQDLEHLCKRVIARNIPQEFKAKNLKTLNNLQNVAMKFTEKENCWDVIELGNTIDLEEIYNSPPILDEIYQTSHMYQDIQYATNYR